MPGPGCFAPERATSVDTLYLNSKPLNPKLIFASAEVAPIYYWAIGEDCCEASGPQRGS